jgi:hypothetical protein
VHNPLVPALIAAGIQCSASLALTPVVHAQSRDEPFFVLADTVTATGTVDEVDPSLREVRLRTEDGQVLIVRVDPTVSNFGRIAAGDRLTVEFLASTAVSIAVPEAASGAAGPATGRATMVAPRDKPAGVEAGTVQVTATIDDIDYAKRRATLRSPEGALRSIHIDDRIGNIERFRKGDTVMIRYTEAVAISVSR